MRAIQSHRCGCFPTGRHYPGIADRIAEAIVSIQGLCEEFAPALAWTEMPWIVIDFETTGLDPEKDRILEVGLVCFDGGCITLRENYLINPGIPVSEEARSVHRITDEEIANAPRFAEVADRIVELLSDRLPIAYNAEFDRRFLELEMARVGVPLRDAAKALILDPSHGHFPREGVGQVDGSPGKIQAFGSRLRLPPALRAEVIWVDPLVWAREILQGEKSKKLADVAAVLGISLEVAHRAAGDAEATGGVLLALAQRMPRTYGELIRIQQSYAAHQDVEFSVGWRAKRIN